MLLLQRLLLPWLGSPKTMLSQAYCHTKKRRRHNGSRKQQRNVKRDIGGHPNDKLVTFQTYKSQERKVKELLSLWLEMESMMPLPLLFQIWELQLEVEAISPLALQNSFFCLRTFSPF